MTNYLRLFEVPDEFGFDYIRVQYLHLVFDLPFVLNRVLEDFGHLGH